MEHKLCGLCQSSVPCLILCSCNQPLCRPCSERIISEAAFPHCPACDHSLPLQQHPLSASPVKKPSKESLMRTRVVQRNLIYIIGLSSSLAASPHLSSPHYFGQYGKIKKLVVNFSNPFSSPHGLSYSAYITFSTEMEATLCARACDGFKYDGMTLKTTFGTSKYCHSFLDGKLCNKAECTYLHELGSRIDSFTREEIQRNIHMQPHNSIFPLLKVAVEPPSGQTKLPLASVPKPRCFSEDVAAAKKENRKVSRFGFDQDNGEDGAEVPSFLGDLVALFSPGQMESRLPAEQVSELMKDRWAKDVLHMQKNFNNEFLVRGYM